MIDIHENVMKYFEKSDCNKISFENLFRDFQQESSLGENYELLLNEMKKARVIKKARKHKGER